MDLNITGICKKVLSRMSNMAFEKTGGSSKEKLIFPKKIQSKGVINRISEQELRQLFIEEFKKDNNDYFYSIETPTLKKYRFKDSENSNTQSALHDMCVFDKDGNDFVRKLNIEFKSANGAYKNTYKDITKLVCEDKNGVFIQLLRNTRRDTLCNEGETGVFDKLKNSFQNNHNNWGSKEKTIIVVIFSLAQKKLISIKIKKASDLNNIFSFEGRAFGNINEVNKNYWETYDL